MAKVNGALTLKIQEFYDQIVDIYCCPRNFSDMCNADLACGENRVARLIDDLSWLDFRAGFKRRLYGNWPT